MIETNEKSNRNLLGIILIISTVCIFSGSFLMDTAILSNAIVAYVFSSFFLLVGSAGLSYSIYVCIYLNKFRHPPPPPVKTSNKVVPDTVIDIKSVYSCKSNEEHKAAT